MGRTNVANTAAASSRKGIECTKTAHTTTASNRNKINEARSNYFPLFYRQSSDGISHILIACLISLIIYCALIALFNRPN
ncbi:Uncharacterised protein [Vibrio cholerae]|nr:Uncharacterised protein [Vibrio cholerae]